MLKENIILKRAEFEMNKTEKLKSPYRRAYLIFLSIILIFNVSCTSKKRTDISTEKVKTTEEIISKEKNSNSITSNEKSVTEQETYIVCEIKGLVNKPGVYKLKRDSRVKELIEASGGVTSTGTTDNINLAKKLNDGEVVVVQDKNTTVPLATGSTTVKDTKTNKININTASKEELESIPGIGKVTAENIINYREKNGPFKKVEDIKNVDRIGEKTFIKIEEFIKIE